VAVEMVDGWLYFLLYLYREATKKKRDEGIFFSFFFLKRFLVLIRVTKISVSLLDIFIKSPEGLSKGFFT